METKIFLFNRKDRSKYWNELANTYSARRIFSTDNTEVILASYNTSIFKVEDYYVELSQREAYEYINSNNGHGFKFIGGKLMVPLLNPGMGRVGLNNKKFQNNKSNIQINPE